MFSSIYNAVGQQTRILKDSFTPIGLHRIEWDGRDHQGSLVASGVYFLQVRNRTGIVNKKLLLLR